MSLLLLHKVKHGIWSVSFISKIWQTSTDPSLWIFALCSHRLLCMPSVQPSCPGLVFYCQNTIMEHWSIRLFDFLQCLAFAIQFAAHIILCLNDFVGLRNIMSPLRRLVYSIHTTQVCVGLVKIWRSGKVFESTLNKIERLQKLMKLAKVELLPPRPVRNFVFEAKNMTN